MARRNEIQDILNTNEYMGVHFSNEVLFTYIYCEEVSEIQSILEGMINFTVPATNRYAIVRSKDAEPYRLIDSYLTANTMQNDPGALACYFASEIGRAHCV